MVPPWPIERLTSDNYILGWMVLKISSSGLQRTLHEMFSDLAQTHSSSLSFSSGSFLVLLLLSYSGPLASTKYLCNDSYVFILIYYWWINFSHNHSTPYVNYKLLKCKFSGCPMFPRRLPTQMTFNISLLKRM